MLNAASWQRVGHRLHRLGIPLLPRVVTGLVWLVFRCYVDSRTAIGRGSRFAYGGIGVVVHTRAKIGERVIIGQQVTIGGRSRHVEVPVIEDDVWIGPGARVLGPITVGRGSVIGANAVVIQDVPARSIVAGVPARVIRTDIDRDDYV